MSNSEAPSNVLELVSNDKTPKTDEKFYLNAVFHENDMDIQSHARMDHLAFLVVNICESMNDEVLAGVAEAVVSMAINRHKDVTKDTKG